MYCSLSTSRKWYINRASSSKSELLSNRNCLHIRMLRLLLSNWPEYNVSKFWKLVISTTNMRRRYAFSCDYNGDKLMYIQQYFIILLVFKNMAFLICRHLLAMLQYKSLELYYIALDC